LFVCLLALSLLFVSIMARYSVSFRTVVNFQDMNTVD
jgi:hypothetical protein